MRVIRCLSSIDRELRYPVLTIGAFDGIHLGHQEIIRRLIERAREKGGTSVLFTFSDHPLKVLDPARAPVLITPPTIKEGILRRMGLDLLVQIPFTPQWAGTEARSFVEEVLVRTLGAKEIWVGFDFAFGRDRKGNVHQLQDWGRELGFSVRVMPAVVFEGKIVSSTLIRDLLREGRIAETRPLLGRPYVIRGQVVKGCGRGKDLGFPTANLKPPPDFLLPDGVYAGFAKVGDEMHQVAINIGYAPTWGREDRRIEIHFLKFRGDLYRRQLEIHFWERVREERKFSSERELARHIRQDTLQVTLLLSRIDDGEPTNGFTKSAICGNKPAELRLRRKRSHAPGWREEERAH
jgi:riboflavin kinase/FMN adenylyltransferase